MATDENAPIDVCLQLVVIMQIIPNLLFLKSGGYNGDGRINIVLPLYFDSTIIHNIQLDTCFHIDNYESPDHYRLYLVSAIKDIERIRQLINCEGIISIYKR